MPATHAERIALRTANESDRIALRGVRLRARVAGTSLKATVEQTFVNLEPRAIEAVYTFPLPEAAAVCGFEVVFFDKIFTGVVDEADKAIERYDDAIAEGHGAYLLEQHRPDVFSVRVGNLKPRQAVTIRLTYVTDLDVVDRAIRLAFPTTIAPRYATASGTDPIDAAVDGDALNPPHVLSVPYGLSMEVEVDLGKSLAKIESPSHAIQVTPSEASPKSHVVTFAGTLADMDRDVVLTLTLAREPEPFALATTTAQGERFVALSFLPEFDESDLAEPRASETVFVLDCSGSMQGESIAQATAALECCLRAMSVGDTFNVCRFGSTFEMLASEPLVYSDQTLQRAIAFVRQSADLGGTELLAPLQAIFAQRPTAGGARNIVLLTDGQVTNEPAVIALARRHRVRNRLFTFGIGQAASAFLVNGLARATGGAAEFIAPGERIEEKVLRTFGRLASPPVTDVEIDWGDADAEVAPRTLPPIFDGDVLRAFARLPGRIPDTVTLRCNTPTGPKAWTVPVREAADPADVLPSLWARTAIRTIEEEDGIQPSIRADIASPQRARLIEISKRYNLLCALTSFVAVEHRSLEDRNEGKPAVRRVPIQLAAGWGGVDAPRIAPMAMVRACAILPSISTATMDFDPLAAAPAAGAAAPVPPRPAGPTRAGRFSSRLSKALKSRAVPPPPAREVSFDRAVASEPPAPAAAGGDDDLFDLLRHQRADGGFDHSPTVDTLLATHTIDPAALTSAIDQFLDEHAVPSDRPTLRRTLVVLVLLNVAFAARQPVWQRARQKAFAFLFETASLRGDVTEPWLAEMVARFSPKG